MSCTVLGGLHQVLAVLLMSAIMTAGGAAGVSSAEDTNGAQHTRYSLVQWLPPACKLGVRAMPWQALLVVVAAAVLIGALLVQRLVRWLHSRIMWQQSYPASPVECPACHLGRKRSADLQNVTVPGNTVDTLVCILECLLGGTVPAASQVSNSLLQLRHGIGNLYVPEDLHQQVLHATQYNEEVADSLLVELAPESAASRWQHKLRASTVPPQKGCSPCAPVDASILLPSEVLQQIMLYQTSGAAASAVFEDLAHCCMSDGAQLLDTGFDLLSPHNPAHHLASQEFLMPPQNTPISKLEEMLLHSSRLDGSFDAFALAEASYGHPLAAMSYWALHESGLLSHFTIPVDALLQFLHAAEASYPNHPYHNSTHAADVLQSVHAMLTSGGVLGSYADSLSALACYIAAILHDYEHSGTTNDFLVNTGDARAVTYNDVSPNENHHACAGLRLLFQDRHNFLAHLPKADVKYVRKVIIQLILATDMKQHFTLVGQFISMQRVAAVAESMQPAPRPHHAQTCKQHNEVCKLPKDSTTQRDSGSMDCQMHSAKTSSHSSVSHSSCKVDPANAAGQPHLDKTEHLLVLQLMLKSADLGHTCAVLGLHKRWTDRFQYEMFLQGDKEASLGMPVSALCNRQSLCVATSQAGFMNIVVLPMLRSFAACCPATGPMCSRANMNGSYWQQLAQQQAQPTNAA